ncbi:phytoene desaturase family protein [Prauserella muralis]|uniref:Dehydrogenase n=1 Tax=Prauserella muralis TaxID=588067 RepID=A0A2V4AKZ1_9PSEU|nr:NAD(P)/FAD-dependent oxidoreductase [Prauserella muralis]PXY20981.1 dehydrogenase [Prauserella muralis]TWE30045.1 phytoene dehydrogenase-like protein [Prauserella muralis]
MDAAIVGTGPNGLAAGVILARAGLSVQLFEAGDTVGGGLRSAALFDSDVVHDLCSAVHPMAAASRFFREFDLGGRGVEMLRSQAAFAHPLTEAPAGIAYPDLDRTCERLGRDGPRWRRLMAPLIRHSEAVTDLVLSDQRHLPVDPPAALALGPRVLAYGTAAGAGRLFREPTAAALLAGVAAHAIGRLPSLPGGAIAMLLGHLAHRTGWPLPRGGGQSIADALAADIEAHGGVVHTASPVRDLRELAEAKVVLLNVSPRVFLDLAGPLLPERYRKRLRAFRYGPGAAKVDFLVSEPIPWADPDVAAAATVHLGDEQADVFAHETAVTRGERPDEPFVLLVDPAAADPGRAHRGRRPVWAYCHVPNGDRADARKRIQARIEQFAPGFGDTVLACRSVPAAELEDYNPNYVGGDIAAGAITLPQMLARPALRADPYGTPLPGVYLCSASTPPGPSVHGMAGYHAARAVLRREFGVRQLPSLQPDPARYPGEAMR